MEAPEAGALGRLFSRFVVSRDVAGEEVARLRAVPPAELRPEPSTRTLPRTSRLEGGGVGLAGEDYEATLSADGRQAHVVGRGRFPIETVLKVMLARALARRGGLLVHGVAVAHQGRAALFTGHSGAGKSTLGALWGQAGGQVLADELVAVWPEAGGGWRAAGTPWNVGQPVEARLTAVGTLAWDAASRWEVQPAGEVGRMLLLNALLPEATPAGRGGLLAAAGRLLSEVAPVRLVFARDASVATAIQGALGHG
ncbi:putative ATP-binding membrane transport protein [Myxococcus hansupus]|uniref:Putative ATP-binding membrane transport protein n=1 Tax=Pseudomyxococcus hansupus TaxID=1297742 RepID=A0A0H4WY63_9BACT|nr:putative ATP-binding membrane transport protein [Myxococcus hansupus]